MANYQTVDLDSWGEAVNELNARIAELEGALNDVRSELYRLLTAPPKYHRMLDSLTTLHHKIDNVLPPTTAGASEDG